MSTPVVPAIIPKSLEHLRETLDLVQFSKEVQIDLVDGVFVKQVSWPYEPAGMPIAIKHAASAFTLEVDLMVSEPLKAAAAWIEAGADMIVFHIETLSVEEFVAFVNKYRRISFGVSMHGDTTLDQLKEYVTYADYVQLMGIAEIGAQGQDFDETVIEKIAALRHEFPDMDIAVDGSVNMDTIKRLHDAGATRFIAGSAVVLQDNPEEAHQILLGLIN